MHRFSFGALLLSTLSLAACGDEDRVLRISCQSERHEAISVQIPQSYTPGMRLAIVNMGNFTLGTILKIVPEAAGGKIASAYNVRVGDADISLPQHILRLLRVVDGPFTTAAGPEVVEGVNARGLDLARIVADHTSLVLDGQRSSLSDPVSLINADKNAIALIKQGDSATRFAIVDAVAFGDATVVYDEESAVLLFDFFKVGTTYFHVDYECSDLRAEFLAPNGIAKSAPLLLLYTPITYDAATNKVDRDARPLSMNHAYFYAERI